MKSSDKEYFTVVFKGDIGKLRMSPMAMETDFGKVVAAGRGNAFEEADKLREELESISPSTAGE